MPQSIPKGLARNEILKTLVELDAGLDHTFGKATGYELVHEGKRYAPKAVIGVAFRYVTEELLRHSQFSGSEAPGQANYELRQLGFKVKGKEKASMEDGAGSVWAPEEVSVLVADYFAMLQSNLIGEPYNKAKNLEDIGYVVGTEEAAKLWHDVPISKVDSSQCVEAMQYGADQ